MDPYLNIVLRTVAVYFFIVGAIRLFGKKELAQLSVFDLVFILLISNAVQNAMVGPDNSLEGGLIAAGSLFIINFILKRLTFRHKLLNKFLQGEPIMLVHNGELLKSHMDRVGITQDEIEAAMREHGVSSIASIDLAVLETDGNISILSQGYQKKTVRKRKTHKALMTQQ